ncbi:MAG: PEP-CTERM sorting domain-containing protein [Burkholderiaceae bacterium]|nr:PEP-CTERM sorting domain-containing protein [Burkholderiaceae bacterium]
MNFSVARLARTALIAAGVSLAGVGAAQAALWTGAWDPRYGTPFDGNFDADVLGWRGIATFDIPEFCIVGNTATSSACSAMSLVSAQVEFYNFNTDATVETFNYAPGDLSDFSATFGAGGVLTSLVSNFFEPRSPVSNFSVINLYTFSLQFVEDGVRMYHTKDYDVLGFPVGPYSPEKCDGNWLLRISQPWVCGYSGTYSDGSAPAPAVLVSFSKVPEPGSIALLFAAGLAGLGVYRLGRRSPAH